MVLNLGTTNSVVAVMEGGKPTVIPNSEVLGLLHLVVAYTKKRATRGSYHFPHFNVSSKQPESFFGDVPDLDVHTAINLAMNRVEVN